MTSLETTLANAAARAAETEWKGHRGHCARCTRATRQCQYADLCPDGSDIYRDHRDAQRELARNRQLDKLPAPDQETLL